MQKTRGKKSHATVPLRAVVAFDGLIVNSTVYDALEVQLQV